MKRNLFWRLAYRLEECRASHAAHRRYFREAALCIALGLLTIARLS